MRPQASKDRKSKPKRLHKSAKRMPKKSHGPIGWPKMAKKEPEFTKNAYFWDSCAQGLISTRFLSNLEAIYPRNATKIRKKTHLFQDRLKNEKLRFDCAGASGSRVEPSRKACKSKEKRPANQHTYKADFTPKSSSKKLPFLCANLTSRSLPRPSLPKPLYLKS